MAYRFRPIEPKSLCVGDLVQVEMSFVAVPQRDNKRKLKAILRSVALLDDGFAKVRCITDEVKHLMTRLYIRMQR